MCAGGSDPRRTCARHEKDGQSSWVRLMSARRWVAYHGDEHTYAVAPQWTGVLHVLHLPERRVALTRTDLGEVPERERQGLHEGPHLHHSRWYIARRRVRGPPPRVSRDARTAAGGVQGGPGPAGPVRTASPGAATDNAVCSCLVTDGTHRHRPRAQNVRHACLKGRQPPLARCAGRVRPQMHDNEVLVQCTGPRLAPRGQSLPVRAHTWPPLAHAHTGRLPQSGHCTLSRPRRARALSTLNG
jgi:hypothetical protein